MAVNYEEDFPQLVEGQWCSDKGNWATVTDTRANWTDDPNTYCQSLGVAIMGMLNHPTMAMSALKWRDHHVQISREEPGGQLTIKEISR